MNNVLILLIGTNPLPNYVVAEYLLSKSSSSAINEIWLVYSERRRDIQGGTKDIADRLKEVLIRRYPDITFKECSLSDIGDACQIKKDIEEKLLKHISGGNVHFNYTGGTKAMAVHVYRTIEQSTKFNKRSFSYLDAREFVLKDDDYGKIKGDLRENVFISLDNLIKLHGYEKVPQINYHWEEPLKILKDLIDRTELEEFLKWEKEVIRELYYKDGKFIDKVENITKILTEKIEIFHEHTFKEKSLPLLNALPPEYSILDKSQTTLLLPENKADLRQIKTAITCFLDGKWLENYVYLILKNKIDKEFSPGLIPIERNWEFIRPGGGKPFEIDIMILNGYQVCGISCTTDIQEGLCKEKGFEIIHRINQIGGEEARAVLITALSHQTKEGDKVANVEEELKYETGGGNKLIILGVEDLKEDKLWKKIKKHVWGSKDG